VVVSIYCILAGLKEHLDVLTIEDLDACLLDYRKLKIITCYSPVVIPEVAETFTDAKA
jgi:hypothetical protein